MNQIQQEEKKKSILKAQYEKSIETINLIKVIYYLLFFY